MDDRPASSQEAGPSSRSLPRHATKSFAKLCELFIIIQEVAVVYKMPGTGPVAERVPLMFVEAKYQKLLAWLDTLGRDWIWNESSPYYHIFFQYVLILSHHRHHHLELFIRSNDELCDTRWTG